MAILTRQTRQRVLAQTLPSSIAKRVNQRLNRFDVVDAGNASDLGHSDALCNALAQKKAQGASARDERQTLLEDDFLLLLANAAPTDNVGFETSEASVASEASNALASPDAEAVRALSLVVASTDARGAHWAPGHIYLGQTTASGRHYDANDAYLGFTDAQGRLWDAKGGFVGRTPARVVR